MTNKKQVYLLSAIGIAGLIWFCRPKAGTGVLSPVRSYPGPDGPPSVKNNNPFNVKKSGNAWQGKVTSLYPGTDDFEKFESYFFGIRAGIKNARTQYGRGYNTIDLLIRRLTPGASSGGDNPDQAVDDYIQHVSEKMSISPFVQFPWTKNNVENLTRAIVDFEAGKPNFSQTEFEKAWQNV